MSHDYVFKGINIYSLTCAWYLSKNNYTVLLLSNTDDHFPSSINFTFSDVNFINLLYDLNIYINDDFIVYNFFDIIIKKLRNNNCIINFNIDYNSYDEVFINTIDTNNAEQDVINALTYLDMKVYRSENIFEIIMFLFVIKFILFIFNKSIPLKQQLLY